MANNEDIDFEIHLEEPSQELLEWARENIRENPDTKCLLIDELREMIYSRGECTPKRIDDAFLLRFLRARNFSLEGAYKLFVNYCSYKDENVYDGDWIELLRRICDTDMAVIPPYREKNGRRIIFLKIGNWDPAVLTVDELLSAIVMVIEIATLEPSGQILGAVPIIDLSNLLMKHVWYMNPGLAYKLMQILVTSFPMKIHSLHVLNQSKLFDIVFNLFKPFLNDRMRERLFMHGNDMSRLHQYIDPKNLPQEYGGIHPHYDNREWFKLLVKNDSVLKEMKSIGYKTSFKADDMEY